MGTGFLSSVGQSGALGKGIILFLFMVSIYSWAVIIYKNGRIRAERRRSLAFLAKYREDPDEMLEHYADRTDFGTSPFAMIFQAGLAELALIIGPSARTQRALSMVQMDGLERGLERAISEQVMDLRRHLIVLATTAGTAPFVGLFGTVWGIMKAFAAMTLTGSASISSVAPGVSAALTTTVAGLAVAIPALVGYNYLMNNVRELTQQMENFSSEFLSIVERKFGAR
ncbi:MAG: MotA/TolQ/ExbB proton channel family protein [Candidatus Eisenbacteria bacterium]|nr:MotA/TolQ/ExbB proton channel family protein [Candidatus Eisenbacteria bacterium]